MQKKIQQKNEGFVNNGAICILNYTANVKNGVICLKNCNTKICD